MVSGEVNNKPIEAVLFVNEENAAALKTLKKRFKNNHLLETQTGPGNPNLWIPPMKVDPDGEVTIRYEMRPRCCIKIN